jgi:hypothetical protein
MADLNLALEMLGRDAGASRVINDVLTSLNKLDEKASHTTGFMSKLGGAFGGVVDTLGKVGLAGLGIGGIISGISSVASGMVSGNAEMETYETQLSTLLGSADKAKDRLAELAKFGAETPFDLPEVVRAEKVLVGFGLTGEKVVKQTGLDATHFRTLVGDIAAGTGQAFEDIALNMGKFSAGATGEAISRFQELGIATKEQMAAMGVQFSKSGELLSPIPQAMEAIVKISQEKFGGGMDKLSKTFEGQMSTLSDNINQAKTAVMQPIFNVLRDSLAGINSVMSSDVFQKGLQNIAEILAGVVKQGVDIAVIGFNALRQAIEILGPIVIPLVQGIVENIGNLISYGQSLVDFGAIWEGLSLTFKGIWELLGNADWTGSFYDGILKLSGGSEELSGIINDFILRLIVLWNTLSNNVFPVIQQGIEIWKTYASYILEVVKGGDTLNNYLADIPDFLKPVVGFLGDVVNALRSFSLAVLGFSDMDGMWGELGNAVNSFSAIFVGAFDAIIMLLNGDVAGAWDYFKDVVGISLGKVKNSLSVFLTEFLSWAGDFIPAALKKIGEWGAVLWGWVSPQIPKVITALGNLASDIWDWISRQVPIMIQKLGTWKDQFLAWIIPVVENIANKLGAVKDKVLDWIANNWQPILEKLLTWGQAFLDWVIPIVQNIGNKIKEIRDKVVDWVGNNWRPILEKLETWGSTFIDWIAPTVKKLPDELATLATAAIKWIGEQAEPILKKLGEWKDQFTAWIGPATDQFLKEWPGNLNRFLDWIEKDAAPKIKQQLVTWIKTFSDWIGGENKEGTAAGGLFQTIGAISGVVFTFISKTAEVLAPRLLTWSAKFLGWVATDVIPFLATELGKILIKIGEWLARDAIPWAIEKFKDLGKAIITGIVNGILASPNAIKEAIGQLTNFSPTVKPIIIPPPVSVPIPPQWQPTPEMSRGITTIPMRDIGGEGLAGRAYGIGVPEIFVPHTNGRFIPLGGAASKQISVTIGQINTHNTAQEVTRQINRSLLLVQ